MAHRDLRLDADAGRALAEIRTRSRERPVLVFKKSPICPESQRAEAQLRRWLETLAGEPLALCEIDVIAERALARGLTKELAVRHESPQALWFVDGELAWHGSHGALTRERFQELLEGAEPGSGSG